jgi:phosphoribosyl-AMP cyclohydrolase
MLGSFSDAPLFGLAIRQEPTSVTTSKADSPDFSKGEGLLPAIAQDAKTGEVLMLAYMNPESYAETLATGRAVYFSRSRNKLWRKGEESGNVQKVQSIYLDCDTDTILLKVDQIGGAACHEGYSSCFFRQVMPEGLKVIGNRVFDPKEVYKK